MKKNTETAAPEDSDLADYTGLLLQIKTRIQSAQVRAALSVNRELVLLYWSIGRDILERQRQQGWGAKVIDRLSADLRHAFPQMKGFSARNLVYMQTLASAYPEEDFTQQVVAQIPWGHNLVILDKVQDSVKRKWYLQAVSEYGWSRSVLQHQIETGLYERQGKAITNFARTLRDIAKPIGVAAHLTRQVEEVLAAEFSHSLPTIEEIEAELSQASEMPAYSRT